MSKIINVQQDAINFIDNTIYSWNSASAVIGGISASTIMVGTNYLFSKNIPVKVLGPLAAVGSALAPNLIISNELKTMLHNNFSHYLPSGKAIVDYTINVKENFVNFSQQDAINFIDNTIYSWNSAAAVIGGISASTIMVGTNYLFSKNIPVKVLGPLAAFVSSINPNLIISNELKTMLHNNFSHYLPSGKAIVDYTINVKENFVNFSQQDAINFIDNTIYSWNSAAALVGGIRASVLIVGANYIFSSNIPVKVFGPIAAIVSAINPDPVINNNLKILLHNKFSHYLPSGKTIVDFTVNIKENLFHKGSIMLDSIENVISPIAKDVSEYFKNKVALELNNQELLLEMRNLNITDDIYEYNSPVSSNNIETDSLPPAEATMDNNQGWF